MKTVIGIDPGTTGAIAVYEPENDFIQGIWDMPNMEREYGKGLQIDGVKLHNLLMEISDEESIFIVEDVGAMPKQGSVSTFNFGHSVGTIYGVISSIQLPRYRVHPKTWKTQFGLIGTGKYATLEMVREEYLETQQYLTLKKHHNRADAVAIAVAGSMRL